MKQAIYSLAAILCLMTMLVNASSCMAMSSHAKAASTDCHSHSPQNQPAPACCTAYHQLSASATVFTIEQPAQTPAIHSLAVTLDARTLTPPSPLRIFPPPLPPLLKLRI